MRLLRPYKSALSGLHSQEVRENGRKGLAASACVLVGLPPQQFSSNCKLACCGSAFGGWLYLGELRKGLHAMYVQALHLETVQTMVCTTFSDGCVGLSIDEGRSELRGL